MLNLMKSGRAHGQIERGLSVRFVALIMALSGCVTPDSGTGVGVVPLSNTDATADAAAIGDTKATGDGTSDDGTSDDDVCNHRAAVGCDAKSAPCLSDANCASGVCDMERNACVPCLTSKHCGEGAYCKAGSCTKAPACTSDTHCKASNQVCATSEGVCVDCKGDGDCGDKMRCVNYSCKVKVPCTSSKQCAQVCDVKAGVCVTCLANVDCVKGMICDAPSGSCRPAICSGAACVGISHFTCKADGSGYETGESCADDDACTDDACEAKDGCTHVDNGAACDDKDGCTTDSCSPTKGCVFTPHSEGCDDGDECTTADSCSAGACVGGKKLGCDDGNLCTDDSCESASGCVNANSSISCDDGSLCTIGDSCKAGKCASGAEKDCDDKKLCTSDSCDAKTGKCVNAANTLPCDDGDKCTTADGCKGGTCVGGKPTDCDDGTTCSADSCEPKTGCKHVPIADGTVCAAGGCKAGKCMALAPSLGQYFTCALKNGGVRCFGSNDRGQLGAGNKDTNVVVADVVGLSNVTQISAGSRHACARLSDGTVRCWGDGSYGQLGHGSITFSALKPVQVKGLSKVVGLSSSSATTCAWRTDGSAACWGQGGDGERGDGSTSPKKPEPQKLLVKGKVTSIASGIRHACAVTASGEMWCWGNNKNNRILAGSEQYYLTPVQIKGLPAVQQAAAGASHTCALVQGGDVWCWGSNTYRQTTGSSKYIGTVLKPKKVANVPKSIAIAAGYNTTCALGEDGKVRCWGTNAFGEAGSAETSTKYATVTAVSGLSKATALAMGWNHSCAFSGEKLMCWGSNWKKQLGLKTAGGPYKVVNIADVTDLSLGYYYGCAVQKDGSAWCWGTGDYGKLGNGIKTGGRPAPGKVVTKVKFEAIRAGRYTTCGLVKGGSVWCWGYGGYGLLGNGKSSNSTPKPQKMTTFSSVDDLQLGDQFACARSQGKVYCWGRNTYGQLGTGSTTSSSTPKEITSLAGSTAIAVGGRFACAVVKDGTVRCWGYNTQGQLGIGNKTLKKAPVTVKGLSNIVAIMAGSSNACARDKAGKLNCWGTNYYRQVGPYINNNSYTPYVTPHEMTGFSGPILDADISARSACVILGSGVLMCQGYRKNGQLLDGDGSGLKLDTPSKSTLDGVSRVVLEDGFSCALKTDGTVWCAGDNDKGQVGDGSAWRFAATAATVY